MEVGNLPDKVLGMHALYVPIIAHLQLDAAVKIQKNKNYFIFLKEPVMS
jgi:hypothetical protein